MCDGRVVSKERGCVRDDKELYIVKNEVEEWLVVCECKVEIERDLEMQW